MKESLQDFTDAELKIEHAKVKHVLRKKTKSTARIQPFDTIEPEAVAWYWPGRVALGKLSIFAGDPGLGKSQAALDLCARGSCGRPFPDGEPCTAGDSIILTSEDDPGDTIRPRLDALGATLDRIHYLHCRIDPKGKESTPSLVDVDTFADSLDQVEAQGGTVRLLVIDPLDAYLAGADAYKNAEVRDVLGPLLALARARRFAVLGIQHMNKGQGPAAYRVGGSIAFTALSRATWIFCKDPEDDFRRLFLCLKNNLAKDNTGLAYSIHEADNGSPLIVWGETVEVDVRVALGSQTPRKDPDRIAPEQDRILGILQARAPGSVRRKELAEATGKSEQAVTNILSKLRDQGLVQPSSVYGFWEAVIEQTLPTIPIVSAVSSVSSVSAMEQTPQTPQTAETQGTPGSVCCPPSGNGQSGQSGQSAAVEQPGYQLF